MIAVAEAQHKTRLRPDIARLVALVPHSGEVALTFLTVDDAADVEDIEPHRIERAIKTGLKCGGYIWRWDGTPPAKNAEPALGVDSDPESKAELAKRSYQKSGWVAVNVTTGESMSYRDKRELKAAGYGYNSVWRALKLRRVYRGCIWFPGDTAAAN